MKILLANLGNRNITYQGRSYPDFTKEEKAQYTFREWTKSLIEEYDLHQHSLDINILNPLLIPRGQYEKVYLYASDQSNIETRTDQDTVYEADIIKNILCDKYAYEHEEIVISRERLLQSDRLRLRSRHGDDGAQDGVHGLTRARTLGFNRAETEIFPSLGRPDEHGGRIDVL